MSQECLEMLLGRLLTDDSFRSKAATRLASLCEEEGYRLTPDELRLIRPEDIVRLTMVSCWMDAGSKRHSHI